MMHGWGVFRMPEPSAISCANADNISPASAGDVYSKAKSINPFDVPQLIKCLALDRAVRSLLALVVSLSAFLIWHRVGATATLLESDKPSASLDLSTFCLQKITWETEPDEIMRQRWR